MSETIYSASTSQKPPAEGKLVANIMNFARTLRAAGLPIGPGRVIEAVRAVETAGLQRREDLYWTLFSVFVNRRDQREIFDQAFHIFWRNPKLLEKMMGMLLPQIDTGAASESQKQMSRRLQEALQPGQGESPEDTDTPPEVEMEATLTFSDRELLQKKDFEQMSAAEIAQAMKAIRRLTLPIREARTRRTAPSPHGPKIDMRATFRHSLKPHGVIELARRVQRRRPPPLVILCDISGSMSKYSRMFLHFMHAITNDRDRVHCFTFGTRLTNISRALRNKDVDVALAKASAQVEDWSGGTRIGTTLEEFNRLWSRRVLGQGAVVLLITDGLDRDGAVGLDEQMERLHKSCRRLIWLNPLLRYEGYEPRSLGNRAMIAHVDEFRPVHNLDSLGELVDALSAPGARRMDGLVAWQARARAA
ncbi:VWA domain-containing protein [Vineibacter terrae]|uniref:VWA domain-containing protein n=1 Tax=Vineibacter terrae TaxID=2586908 RepID=A0A5C8PID0_9HYPH|nr:VWA domain-containing protein [Vineibacter terrae]TXL72965.1 VWA domain-containing protein [Vineibacter terrae]